MQITSANIGDIFMMDHMSKLLRIEDVSDEFVTYRHENGNRYATYEHEIDGHVVNNPELIQRFNRNSELGAALNAAESKAFRTLFDFRIDEAGREAAQSVLDSVWRQREHLEEEIAKSERGENTPSLYVDVQPNLVKTSIEDLIRRADKQRNLQSTAKQQSNIDHSNER